MNDFSALDNAFGVGSLSAAKWKLRQGDHLDPETVAAVKEQNPNWRDDPEFAAFDARSDGGRKRRRGRPRETDLKPRERIAEAFYPLALEYIQRKRSKATLNQWLAAVEHKRIGYIDPMWANHEIAAEAIRSFFKLQMSSTRFLKRMAERGTGRRYRSISQI